MPDPSWEDHSCVHPPEVAICAGCKQREELHLQPISQRVRDEMIRREMVERGPAYAAFGVGSVNGSAHIWLAVCSWCGAVVTASKIGKEPMSSTAHTAWHRKLLDAIGDQRGIRSLL